MKAMRQKSLMLGLGAALWLVWAVPSHSQMLTLTHFATPYDFPTLHMLGYDGVVLTLDPSKPATWQTALDSAQAWDLKLIVGGFPPPYQYNNLGGWVITPNGMALLNYLQSRANLVLALYVFNEPYYTNPYTSQTAPCGYFSASDLRALRLTIQSVWPGVKIYQDLGNPAEWAPNGSYASRMPCVGSKYADQTGVADYVGIWEYPFGPYGGDVNGNLSTLRGIANFVLNSMQPAQPISLNQVFACPSCGPPLTMPTRQQVLQWNCATRALPLAAVDWYAFRRFIPTYSDALGDNPWYWPVTTAGACGKGMGADLVGVSAASGMPFVAPNSLVSVYGANLSPSTQLNSEPLPTSTGGMALQVVDSAGNKASAPLEFVSASQINFLMPANVAPGQAALTLSSASGPVAAGTVLIRKVAPALFTADGSGTGAAAGALLRISSDLQESYAPLFQCSATSCASVPVDVRGPGTVYLMLYGTGIRNYTQGVSCYINGVSVPIAAAVPQGEYEGLDQVNVGPLPDLSGIGEVNLMLFVDGQAANVVRVNFL